MYEMKHGGFLEKKDTHCGASQDGRPKFNAGLLAKAESR